MPFVPKLLKVEAGSGYDCNEHQGHRAMETCRCFLRVISDQRRQWAGGFSQHDNAVGSGEATRFGWAKISGINRKSDQLFSIGTKRILIGDNKLSHASLLKL
jgi:hypothetical protein